MIKEFSSIEKFVESNDKDFLSIGSGIGGLELIINQYFKNNQYYFIERNYVSKKLDMDGEVWLMMKVTII